MFTVTTFKVNQYNKILGLALNTASPDLILISSKSVDDIFCLELWFPEERLDKYI